MKKRRNQNNKQEKEENKDELNNLPDCILLQILSLLNAKDAVRTCLLSTRWKYLWRHLPILNLSSSNFRNLNCFSNFVSKILTFRDSSTPINALRYEYRGTVYPHILTRCIKYAASHNVNHLRISCNAVVIRLHQTNFNHFPPSFSCPSLTSLDLEYQQGTVIFPNSLNFPSLIYLKLYNLSFCSGNDGRIEPFSTFNKLNTLILLKCQILDAQQPLCISCISLLNLSIHSYVRDDPISNIELFAPNLCSFAIICGSFPKLSASHLSSIKQVNLDLRKYSYPVETTTDILNLLIEMTDIETLTVNPKTLEVLSFDSDILKLSVPSLCKLKLLQLNVSLHGYQFSPSSWRDIKMELEGDKSCKLPEAIKAALGPSKSSIMDGMIDFLLQNSPSAKVDVITYQTLSTDNTFFRT